ncbi:hypothetical protein [Blastococcus sp. URHD0036]|uniref:hypothetical protein n=1 Tax=Blastococcus sp. URHD0036 TaxID=1380356 RepID=UPI0012DDEBBF|nr:hypothetical protein [Blastococcus sp. URHD0036]
MASGRIRRSARRGVAGALLLWLAVLGAVLAAPSATAAETVPVDIRDLTPPLVSIDPGDTVRFTNLIEDKTLQVGGGGLLPTLVTVTVHTDVTLRLPTGDHPLQRGQAWEERFPDPCIGPCWITYTYRVSVPDGSIVGSVLNTVTSRALAQLPQNQVVTYNGAQTTVAIGVPTPFIVNTLIPLPNLPSINLPRIPVVDVPTLLPGAVLPELPQSQPPVAPAPAPVPAPPAPSGVDGLPYAYDTGLGAADMSPAGSAPLDLARFTSPSGGSALAAGSAPADGSGSGGYSGATVPVFGQLSGLDAPALDEESATTDQPGQADRLPVVALLAVVALAASTAALVRTRTAGRTGGRHSR